MFFKGAAVRSHSKPVILAGLPTVMYQGTVATFEGYSAAQVAALACHVAAGS